MVHASSRLSSERVHSTSIAPMPVAIPAPVLIAKAAPRWDPKAIDAISRASPQSTRMARLAPKKTRRGGGVAVRAANARTTGRP